MATSQRMKFCKKCKAMTLHLHHGPNHVLHLLLTLITCGVWLLIWLMAAANRGDQCTVCGRG